MSYDVVVPAYNVEKTIGATLESLLEQTLPPARIIVADDASPDDAMAVAERYPVEILRFEHGGLAATQNKALEHVTADYVAYCDSDDVWHPEAGRMLVEALERTGAVVASLSPDRFRDGAAPAFADPPRSDSRDVPYDELVRRNLLIKAGTMYLTRAVRDVGGWREELTVTSDHDIALRMMDAGGRVELLEWRGLGQRVMPGGMSRNPGKALRSQLDLALPRLTVDGNGRGDARRHATTLWLRALARATEDRRDLREVPTLTEMGVSGARGQRAAEVLVRSPLRHAVAGGWRSWRARRTGIAGPIRGDG